MTLRAEVINFGSHVRQFLLAEPSGVPSLVVLSLHGSGSLPQRQAQLSSMERLCPSGAVVAFPRGAWPLRSGFEWDIEGDVEYLRVLVNWLLARYPEADRRVCITGMSGGARMSSHFASVHPDLVGAVGAVAGLRSPGIPVQRPVPILAFHGTKDRLNPYGGSGTPRWNESVLDAARAWALANGITDPPTEVAVSPTLTRTAYGAEGQPGEVTLWTSRGAGHSWPGGHLGLRLSFYLGRTSKEIDASKSIWEFGLRHAGDP